jgi:hypothetical protein
VKPLSTKPIIRDGVTIANAYQWSFGWCAEWVEFEGEQEKARPFSLLSHPSSKHDICATFETLKQNVLRTHAELTKQGLAFNAVPPTVEVVFYGASDDNIEIEGPIEGADEYGAWMSRDHRGCGVVGIFLLEGYGGACHINAIYDGCWSFAVGQTEENTPLPPWPVSLSAEGYTTKLTLTVPVGTSVSKVGDDDE